MTISPRLTEFVACKYCRHKEADKKITLQGQNGIIRLCSLKCLDHQKMLEDFFLEQRSKQLHLKDRVKIYQE
jgi:hypothetical protein